MTVQGGGQGGQPARPAASPPGADRAAAMVALMAARPRPQPSAIPPVLGYWQRWRGLLDTGWDARNRTPRPLHWMALAFSTLFNLALWSTLFVVLYWRFPPPEPVAQEEGFRIRITGFGIPGEPGGGAEAADGRPSPRTDAARAAPRRATRPATGRLAASTASASAEPPPDAAVTPPALAQQPIPEPTPLPLTPQPLQVGKPLPEQVEAFALPPTQALALPDAHTQATAPPALPEEAPLPGALAEAPALRVPEPRTHMPRAVQLGVEQVIEIPPAQPVAALALPAPRQAAPAVPVAGNEAASSPTTDVAENASRTADTASSVPSPAPTPADTAGLADARGEAAQPGQAHPAPGTGPASRPTPSQGWPSPARDDDWGLGRDSRAGEAQGREGAGQSGQGSGLFDAQGRPRLADDRFAARFPDPYKEGSWLRRPRTDARGTMFDGLWRPPETLLQEWVRRGIRTFDIPLPGGRMKIRCTVSVLQAGGGCFPVPGENGVHDQPARARPAPEVPFKPEWFENPADLSPATPPEPAAPTPEPALVPR